ncbi:type 1 glutamine amidotransferase [Paenibacillus sp. MMS20-IR301]|uniref:type 1 glutamine amidotransferase n=1 Tax=Paenibacillus sp. MMS20-IR301 TaxID=2895946 RepID=UPI0028EEA498|nr:type 1 glutamine amidotransferase [Paenibacillus sp. MMS20-IR301]WNS43137.1 type 1 glutamine amidotransferase [Paenibacillus sp. MMS20-IR301]
MRIHCLQHVPFEAPEEISVWAGNKGHTVTTTLLYESQSLPALEDFDMLVIMGGPMGVYDEASIPWLKREKIFIHDAITTGKLTLGICLGAQLIAEQIGGEVYRNKWKEIGWFPVKLTEEAKGSALFKGFPEQFVPFHWHGDTFSLPAGAKRIAFSLGCANQCFEFRDTVAGLQFHLEVNEQSIQRIMEHCGEEIEPGEYIQSAAEMAGQPEKVRASNGILFTLLEAMEDKHLSRTQ